MKFEFLTSCILEKERVHTFDVLMFRFVKKNAFCALAALFHASRLVPYQLVMLAMSGIIDFNGKIRSVT